MVGRELGIVAAGGIENDERTACDRCPAFGRDGDGQAAARRRTAAHAARPSWSVSFIAGVTLTKLWRALHNFVYGEKTTRRSREPNPLKCLVFEAP